MGLIGSALGAVGSIFGGISASKAMSKVRDNLNQQMRENQDWYDRRYNEDTTQRADAQRLLQQTQDAIKRRNRNAAGTAAVMGGTNESVAAEKEAGNQLMADTTSRIAAQGETRKDTIERQYMDRKTALNNQLNQVEQQKAQAISQAIQGVAGAAGGMEFGDLKLKNGKTLSL